ncbi:MAG: DUF4402 domain-containing protein [Bacteroidales bacterium]|nr:DUF4402 domain-containing protein [Bacteroidales bacterium]
MTLGSTSLFSQSVTLKTEFDFGDIVVYPPGNGTVTLAGTSRSTTGSVAIIPSKPGTLYLATFRYTAKAAINITSVSIDNITIVTNLLTVSNFVITPPLPIPVPKNGSVNFTVTHATLNINGILQPGKYTSTPPYTVRINNIPY